MRFAAPITRKFSPLWLIWVLGCGASDAPSDAPATAPDSSPPASGQAGATPDGSGGSAGSESPGAGEGAQDAATSPPPDASEGGATDAAIPDAASGASADSVWSPLGVMAVVDPLDHGAIGDGVADDLGALEAAVDALPEAGGLVFLADGKTFRKSDLLIVTKSHVKFWSVNRGGELLQVVNGTRRRQSILCRQQTGCGFFGLHLRSDAVARFDALEDNQISADRATLVEVVGCEIEGSAATGIFLFGSTEHYIHGNYIHHTWADHVHHTDGARASWVWRNFILNEAPSRGDDGVACVTYGPASPRCNDMEWWSNTILHTDWGRGYSVIGGDDISIHDNWAIGVAGAGIIVASEGSYDSASSRGIRIERNVVHQSGHTIGHPGILISGLNPGAEPLDEIALADNIAVDNPNGAYRAEGEYTAVTNDGLLDTGDALPLPVPTLADVQIEDTSLLRTRDVSHVAENVRAGLHRIHVRRSAGGDGFEQRFEYVLRGAEADVAAFCEERSAAGDHIAEQRTVDGTAHALVLTSAPVVVPGNLTGIPFRELRSGASGELAWLWERIDAALY